MKNEDTLDIKVSYASDPLDSSLQVIFCTEQPFSSPPSIASSYTKKDVVDDLNTDKVWFSIDMKMRVVYR